MVFLILGMAFNTIGISNPNDRIKLTFLGLGSVFLLIAIIRFLKIRKQQ